MRTLAIFCVASWTAAFVSFLVAVLTTANSSGAQFSQLIAFGDSLSDLGNTYNALGGMSSDQTIYGLIGYTASPGRYDDGRWSNGPLWVEHVSDQLGLPALERNDGTQALAFGTDFAFGGSTSGAGHTDFLLANLQTQVGNYLSLAGGGASHSALYTVWSGGNDVIYYIEDGMPNTPTAIEQQANTMASNISTAITTLYNAGARHVLVPNLPALGDKPDYVNTPNQAFANDIVTAYNPMLEQALDDLRNQFPELKLAAWDVYSDFNQMLQNPAMFGFTNVTDASFSSSGPYPGTVVANPDQHVFWDHKHPTMPGHALLGQYAYEALGELLIIPEPATLVLFGMVVAIACVRGRK